MDESPYYPIVVVSNQTNSKVRLMNLLYRALRLSGFYFFKALKVAIKFSITAGEFLNQKTIKATKVMLEKKAMAEVRFNEKLTIAEFNKKEKEIAENIDRAKKYELIQTYYADVQAMYYETVDHINLVVEYNHSAEKIKTNAETQSELLKLISKKIIDSQMIKNVKKMSVESFVKKDLFESSVVIELEKKGYLWAMMFGKYITPYLNGMIEGLDGKVTLKHSQNLMTNRDVMELHWSFKLEEMVVMPDIPLDARAEMAFSEGASL